MFAPWRNSEKLGETQRNLLEIPGELEAWLKSFLHFYIFKMTWNAERIQSSRSRKWSADCMWWANCWRFSPFQGTTSINISYSWCQTNQWDSHSPCCCIRCWIACTAPADNTGWRKRRRAYADWISGNEILCRTQTEKKSVGWSPLHAQEKRMWSIEYSCGSGELSSFFAVPSRVLQAVAYSTWIWR